jgi:hypothetical protein
MERFTGNRGAIGILEKERMGFLELALLLTRQTHLRQHVAPAARSRRLQDCKLQDTGAAWKQHEGTDG